MSMIILQKFQKISNHQIKVLLGVIGILLLVCTIGLATYLGVICYIKGTYRIIHLYENICLFQ